MSSCQYQTFLCNHCKQSVILFEHEGSCPEMPVRCASCSAIILRKNVEVSLMYNHAIEITEEILGVIGVLVLFFLSLSCLLVTFFSCCTFVLLFVICLHVLVNRIFLEKTSTCQYVAETMQLKITKILIANSNYLFIFTSFSV